MFCPNCGTEATQGVNYCKRCGGSLNALSGVQDTRPVITTGTAWAVGVTMLLVVSVGLAAVFGTLSDLVHFVSSDTVVAILIFGGLTVLGSIFLLTRFWMRLLTGTKQSAIASLVAARRANTSELGPARVAALPDTAPPPPISSVTENTTRTLRK
jgi:hypothetical protein